MQCRLDLLQVAQLVVQRFAHMAVRDALGDKACHRYCWNWLVPFITVWNLIAYRYHLAQLCNSVSVPIDANIGFAVFDLIHAAVIDRRPARVVGFVADGIPTQALRPVFVIGLVSWEQVHELTPHAHLQQLRAGFARDMLSKWRSLQ